MTILATAWFRVAFQVQMNAPWRHLMSGVPSEAKDSLVLNYTSMSQPKALLRSLQSRDWIVSLSVAGSIILQLAVIVSAGLFLIPWTRVELQSEPIILDTAFNFNRSDITVTGNLDYHTVSGILNAQSPLPTRNYRRIRLSENLLPRLGKYRVTSNCGWIYAQPRM